MAAKLVGAAGTAFWQKFAYSLVIALLSQGTVHLREPALFPPSPAGSPLDNPKGGLRNPAEHGALHRLDPCRDSDASLLGALLRPRGPSGYLSRGSPPAC